MKKINLWPNENELALLKKKDPITDEIVIANLTTILKAVLSSFPYNAGGYRLYNKIVDKLDSCVVGKTEIELSEEQLKWIKEISIQGYTKVLSMAQGIWADIINRVLEEATDC